MTTLPDLLFVALFAVVGLLVDYFVSWPAFRRRSPADPARVRGWLWAWTIGSSWALVAVGAALWEANDRSWASFGFSVPDGWRLGTSIALILLLATYHAYAVATLARSSEVETSVRQQFFGTLTTILPRTRTDMYWFGGVSLTAGFCEEFLYRGYFVWVFSPWLGWWGAAALSLAFFAIGHLYQGWNGVLRTGLVGAFFTVVVAISGSLWPAIALHALLDLGQGMMAWLVLREGSARGDVVEGEQPTEPQAASGVKLGPVQTEQATSLSSSRTQSSVRNQTAPASVRMEAKPYGYTPAHCGAGGRCRARVAAVGPAARCHRCGRRCRNRFSLARCGPRPMAVPAICLGSADGRHRWAELVDLALPAM